eukprot:snap_masked-scaffold_46-processed-gene-1.71-mRNA-1 protein AED:0.93 eAED:1.00 QI:0/-1/0/1/-1/1/1/0/132
MKRIEIWIKPILTIILLLLVKRIQKLNIPKRLISRNHRAISLYTLLYRQARLSQKILCSENQPQRKTAVEYKSGLRTQSLRSEATSETCVSIDEEYYIDEKENIIQLGFQVVCLSGFIMFGVGNIVLSKLYK